MSECGAGSILAIALLAAIAGTLILLLPLLAVVTTKARTATAADAAALAAADVAVGILPGVPCDEARRTAVANGAILGSCEVDGLVVTVSVHSTALGFAIAASATAGPPLLGAG